MDIVERLRDYGAKDCCSQRNEAANEITKLREELAAEACYRKIAEEKLDAERRQHDRAATERAYAQAELARAKQELEISMQSSAKWKESRNSLLAENEELRSAMQQERVELLGQLEESRANDRTGMGYLSQVRAIVGGDDFPDMVRRVVALRKDAEQYQELIYAVGNKYPGETRHETALRYIRRAESTPLNVATKVSHSETTPD